jgi:hypothetical protein
VLLLTLAASAALSACYAAYTYDLPGIISGSSSTSHSVAIVLGTQSVPAASHLLTELGPALVWLSLFGFAALAAAVRYLRTPPQVLTVLTVLGWCAVMYAGSRTSADGFPTRFERDLGAPLSVMAAFGAGLLLRSLPQAWLARKTATTVLMAVGVAVVGAMLVVPSMANVATDSRTRGNVLSPPVAAAARWLRQHNTGGTIITTPWMKPVSNRAVLAMGGYTGLQSYTVAKIEHPRSLPPAGAAAADRFTPGAVEARQLPVGPRPQPQRRPVRGPLQVRAQRQFARLPGGSCPLPPRVPEQRSDHLLHRSDPLPGQPTVHS